MTKLFMETTQITATRSAGEITSLLVRAGARQILTEYGPTGELARLKFTLEVRGRSLPFALPARSDAIFKILQDRRKRVWTRSENVETDREQAHRIAWRQLLRWVQAQIAMIELGMTEAGEIFMPYIEVEPGVTAWQKAISGGQLMLPEGPRERESNITPIRR